MEWISLNDLREKVPELFLKAKGTCGFKLSLGADKR